MALAACYRHGSGAAGCGLPRADCDASFVFSLSASCVAAGDRSAGPEIVGLQPSSIDLSMFDTYTDSRAAMTIRRVGPLLPVAGLGGPAPDAITLGLAPLKMAAACLQSCGAWMDAVPAVLATAASVFVGQRTGGCPCLNTQSTTPTPSPTPCNCPPEAIASG